MDIDSPTDARFISVWEFVFRLTIMLILGFSLVACVSEPTTTSNKIRPTSIISPTLAASPGPTYTPVPSREPTKIPTPVPISSAVCREGTYDCIDALSTYSPDSESSSPGSGVLQFKSGFEADTHIENNIISGEDNSLSSGNNSWDNLSNYLPWVINTSTYLEGGSIEISNDPTGANNKVLHLNNNSTTGGYSRTQYSLMQTLSWDDDGTPNRFDKQFYRQRIYIPQETKDTGISGWYMIWESHRWDFEPGRHAVYLKKNSNDSDWHFRVVQQRFDLPDNPIVWENTSRQNIIVPFGEWFTLDVFFKYHEVNGEFYVAITREGGPRQVVAHYLGPTKYGTKLRNNTVFKLYHHEDFTRALTNGTHQYYDDFEIWSDYPPGYSK